MRRNNRLLRQMILASIFTAMITVLTCYIKIPTHNGYVHIGDAVIYIAACVLPAPLAVFCGALGGLFADLLGGYTVYALPSFIIKALLVLAFNRKSRKFIEKRNIIAAVIAAALNTAGYFIADAVIFSLSASGGSFFSPAPWAAAIYDIPANLIQSAASLAVFAALGAALDKSGIKQKLTED